MTQNTEGTAETISEESNIDLLEQSGGGIDVASASSIPEAPETVQIDEVAPGIIGIAEKFKATVPIPSLDTFEHAGKKYKVLLPQVEIPDLGILTALDILSDMSAQEYLVNQNAIGSVIQEVIE